MYTQCPDCSMVFRVTANDLKQAAGKVRCGGCQSPFDALESLSEEMPRQSTSKEPSHALPELKPDIPASGLPESVSPEASIALLKTLDELAGSDIQIEDTGIEWRVLDDQVIADLETADAAGDPADASRVTGDPSPDQRRYDDDTPVVGDNGEDDETATPDDGTPEEGEAEQEEADEDTTDLGEDTSANAIEADPESAVEIDFDNDETGDWEEILEEVDEANAPQPADEVADEAAEDDDTDRDETGDADEFRPDVEDEHLPDSQKEPLPEVDEEEVAVESIIMEGETVRSALDDLAEGAQASDADMMFWTPPEESVTETRPAGSRFNPAITAIALLLLLGLQVAHYYRETLATIPAVQNIIVPAYRAIGTPLSPDWDVTGWRFEATQGDADADNDKLTVYARVGNTSDGPLPYPLINIALTDRYDEPVGSRLLQPEEFLTGDANPRKMVSAGATFNAVISVKSPDDSAIGYKLNVCYRSGGAANGQLRCAIGEFKE